MSIVVWGVQWGPLKPQLGNMGPLVTDGVCGKKNGLILDFWPRLFDITHNESHCGKRVILGVFTAVWGVRYGPPWSQMDNMGPLVTDGVGEKNEIGLILDFRPKHSDIDSDI